MYCHLQLYKERKRKRSIREASSSSLLCYLSVLRYPESVGCWHWPILICETLMGGLAPRGRNVLSQVTHRTVFLIETLGLPPCEITALSIQRECALTQGLNAPRMPLDAHAATAAAVWVRGSGVPMQHRRRGRSTTSKQFHEWRHVQWWSEAMQQVLIPRSRESTRKCLQSSQLFSVSTFVSTVITLVN